MAEGARMSVESTVCAYMSDDDNVDIIEDAHTCGIARGREREIEETDREIETETDHHHHHY